MKLKKKQINMKLTLSALFAALIIAPLAMGSPCDKKKDCDKGKKDESTLAACDKCKGDKDKDKEETKLAACDKCKGDLKDKPVVGMRILWDLKKDKKEKNEWSDGRIMDPDNGETYRCYIGVQDGGKKLKVRGYLGIALFGRTQYWRKAE